jgi:hypothetical protein
MQEQAGFKAGARGVKVVVLAPYRYGSLRRERIWRWVKDWYETNFDWPVYHLDSVGSVFSIAQARNKLAFHVKDWDVALMIDADTIAEPGAIREAVDRASKHRQIILAGDVHMRMNERSSDLILERGIWFPRPDGYLPKTGANEHIYGEPSSGCFAIGRELWEATGGFVESMQGWGYEDLVFLTQCYIAGDGVAWVDGSTMLHFWHPRAEINEDTERNHKIYNAFHALSEYDRQTAKEFLRGVGHQW